MALVVETPTVSNVEFKRVNFSTKGWKLSIKGKDKVSASLTKETCSVEDLAELAPPKDDINKHLQNITAILLHTNATPIERYDPGLGYCCSFCPKRYEKPADLKTHNLEGHNDNDKSLFMRNRRKACTSREFLVKVDLTSLTCKICSEPLDTLENAMEHLKSNHDKTLHTDIKNQIVPFKFGDGRQKCVVCLKEFNSFLSVFQHMSVHYRNFPCPKCEHAYMAFKMLRAHYVSHREGKFVCEFCPKFFNTALKTRAHESSVHIRGHKTNKCPHCGEMFDGYRKRLDHMVEKHGVEPLSLKCSACESTFTNQRDLRMHIRKYHLMERKHECNICGKGFFQKTTLTTHLLTHTGKKNFQCDICLKFFSRKCTLPGHMRIHYNDRRFKCEYCCQSFIQKCSWKSHMHSKHGNERNTSKK